MSKPLPIPAPTDEDYAEFFARVLFAPGSCWEWAGKRGRDAKADEVAL